MDEKSLMEDESKVEDITGNLESDMDLEPYESTWQEEDEEKDNPPLQQKDNQSSIWKPIREILIYVVIALLCIFVIPQYVIQRTIVSGDSMENTLYNNDNLLVEKVSYRFDDPKRFDVVIFYPYGKDVNEYYVKRVIGLPGETIQIVGSDIFINGELLEEDYGKDPIHYSGIAAEPLTLGEDEFFLMGDNREISFDSRFSDVGPVHRDLIAGKALIRIWPFSRFGVFE